MDFKILFLLYFINFSEIFQCTVTITIGGITYDTSVATSIESNLVLLPNMTALNFEWISSEVAGETYFLHFTDGILNTSINHQGTVPNINQEVDIELPCNNRGKQERYIIFQFGLNNPVTFSLSWTCVSYTSTLLSCTPTNDEYCNNRGKKCSLQVGPDIIDACECENDYYGGPWNDDSISIFPTGWLLSDPGAFDYPNIINPYRCDFGFGFLSNVEDKTSTVTKICEYDYVYIAWDVPEEMITDGGFELQGTTLSEISKTATYEQRYPSGSNSPPPLGTSYAQWKAGFITNQVNSARGTGYFAWIDSFTLGQDLSLSRDWEYALYDSGFTPILQVLTRTDMFCAGDTMECLNDCSGNGDCVTTIDNETSTSYSYCDCKTDEFLGFETGYSGNDCSLGCALYNDLTDFTGTITDGSGDRLTLQYQYCHWFVDLTSQTEVEFISFAFDSVDLGRDSVLVINDEFNQTLLTLVGHGIPPVVTTQINSKKATVIWSTGEVRPDLGFSLTYWGSPCKSGYFINKESGSCDPCPVGTFTAVPDQFQCNPCGAGSFSDKIGSEICTFCPTTEYQNETGSTFCKICPANSESKFLGALNIDECSCTDQAYKDPDTNECVECPVGGNCTGEGIPTALPLYWAGFENPTFFLKCASTDACKGGLVNESCGSDLFDIMCTRCQPGSYRRFGKCEDCTNFTNTILWLGLLAMFILAFFAYILVNRKNYRRIGTALSITTSVGLLVSFFQVLAVYKEFSINWPSYVESLFELISIINFQADYFAPECALESITEVSRYALRLFAPLLFFPIFGIFYFFGWIQDKIVQKNGDTFKKNHPVFCRDLPDYPNFSDKVKHKFASLFYQSQKLEIPKIINSLVMIFDLLYIYVAQTTFEVFNCYKNTDGRYSWWKDPQTSCYEDEWWNLLPISITGIIIYIIIFPSFLAWIIYKVPTQQTEVFYMKSFSHLFYRFQPAKYYWEVVLITRKIVLTFFVLVFTDTVIQTTLALTLMLCMALLHFYHWPFYMRNCNWLEALFLVGNISILSIACLFIASSPATGGLGAFAEEPEKEDTFAVLVVFIIIFMLVATAVVFTWALFRICFPQKREILAREQEAVVSVWKQIVSAKNINFDSVWDNLPHQEQYHALSSAYAIGFEALGIKGSQKRVSPTKLVDDSPAEKKEQPELVLESFSSSSESQDTGLLKYTGVVNSPSSAESSSSVSENNDNEEDSKSSSSSSESEESSNTKKEREEQEEKERKKKEQKNKGKKSHRHHKHSHGKDKKNRTRPESSPDSEDSKKNSNS